MLGRSATDHYYRPPHRFLTIRHVVAIYVKHSPRSAIKKYAVVHSKTFLIIVINMIKFLIRVITKRTTVYFFDSGAWRMLHLDSHNVSDR